MRILFLGDLVGRNARDAVAQQLPGLRTRLRLDCVIVNAENAAHGFGITGQICNDLYTVGVDAITTGNHVWDQREIIPHIERDSRLVRPLNFPEGTPGRGAAVIECARGQKVLVVNLMGRLYMDPLDDPFAALDRLLRVHRLGGDVQAIVVDMHAEASSEKTAMAYHADGRASFVVGTHTHIPTADARVLPKGTGFQTDAGMCGCFDSVIGMDTTIAVNKFVRKMPGERLRPAEGPVTLCGVVVETDDKTGLCKSIAPLRMGGVLAATCPE